MPAQRLPVELPVEPMLAKAVPTVPTAAPGGGGLLYEPKWDGFRGIVAFDGETVEIGSRGGKPLTRYFPELTAALAKALPGPCLVDGEVVVPTGGAGGQRLDWDALTQRIHPAESRIRRLAAETPASFVAFDLLATADRSLLDTPFGERRAALEAFLADAEAPLFLTRVTDDAARAEAWLAEFEGAGLDGVVAKPVDEPYRPGKRTMLKVKHHRTADVIATGYRIHTSGHGVGSLLVSLYTADGRLAQVGGVSAFTQRMRDALVEELADVVQRDEHGEPVTGEGERSRFSSGRDTSFVVLRPERVLEVRYDQMEGDRFRHTVQFERWRPDRDARSCTYEQLEVPHDYDLAQVLA
ncbi:MAG TPA: ATP-dependent DNA ligase [Amnibacterium sp.]